MMMGSKPNATFMPPAAQRNAALLFPADGLINRA